MGNSGIEKGGLPTMYYLMCFEMSFDVFSKDHQLFCGCKYKTEHCNHSRPLHILAGSAKMNSLLVHLLSDFAFKKE